MNTKRITVILISIAFILVVLLSGVGLFAVKKVEVNYAVSMERDNIDQIQKELDSLLDKNLLFLDLNEVNKVVESQPYLEIVSVAKKYPNLLLMNIKERKETYRIKDGEKAYVLNENGFVLNDTGELLHDGKIIDLEFITFRNKSELTSKIKIESAVVGEQIKTDYDSVLYTTLDIAEKVGLNDCIKKIYIEYCSGEEFDVSFETHTGVKIYIVNIMDGGERKGLTAFNVYDNIATDYQKRFGLLETRYVGDNLVVQHTFDDIDAVDRNDVQLHIESI